MTTPLDHDNPLVQAAREWGPARVVTVKSPPYEPPTEPPTSETLVANSDSATLANGSATGNVLTNDAGPNRIAALASGPSDGFVTVNPDGSFTYTPNHSQVTSDSFTYTLTSSTIAGSASGTVTISGNPTTYTFDAVNDTFTDILSPGGADGIVLTNDVYSGTVTVMIATQPSFGGPFENGPACRVAPVAIGGAAAGGKAIC